MENKDQGIFRTFTFRGFSPTTPADSQFFNPIPSQNRFRQNVPSLSLSSESSEVSFQRSNEFPIKSYKNSQNPDHILDSMIKAVKKHKTIPETLIASLTIDTCKEIVEKLIREKNFLQEELSIKDIPASSDKQESLPSRQKSPPIVKMQAFRALENVSPIEIEDSDGHTNYKIVSLAISPKEEVSPDYAADKVKAFEDYKKEVIKLTNELKELVAYNKILLMIIPLEKDYETEQINQQIKEKIEMYTKLSSEITEELKTIKKTIEPNVGFVENLPLQRTELKVLTKIIGYEKKCDLKPSEMQTVDRLLDLYVENPCKKFEEYVDELLAGHDIAEMANIIVKYIKFLEEEAVVDLHSEALNCFITEHQNEAGIEEIIDENVALSKEFNVLEAETARISYAKGRIEKSKQLKIRQKPKEAEKPKWTLPSSLSSLTGANLYAKALQSLKKK